PGRQTQQGGPGPGVPGGGGFGGGAPGGQNGQNGQQGQQNGAGAGDGLPGGGVGGLLNGASVSSEARKLLEKDAGKYTWVAAAVGSQNAAGYQLATGDPVMAVGGFNGTDPSPTLARFQRYVEEGKIHYFIAGGGMGGGDSGTASRISSWVQSTFKKVTVGSATLYDLTRKA
ncbi:glycosyl transferase, partial [Streptomyces tricolor]